MIIILHHQSDYTPIHFQWKVDSNGSKSHSENAAVNQQRNEAENGHFILIVLLWIYLFCCCSLRLSESIRRRRGQRGRNYSRQPLPQYEYPTSTDWLLTFYVNKEPLLSFILLLHKSALTILIDDNKLSLKIVGRDRPLRDLLVRTARGWCWLTIQLLIIQFCQRSPWNVKSLTRTSSYPFNTIRTVASILITLSSAIILLQRNTINKVWFHQYRVELW